MKITKKQQDLEKENSKETFYSDRMLARGVGKEISELLLCPKGDWKNVCFRSAIVTKLFPIFMKTKEQGINEGIKFAKEEMLKDIDTIMKKLEPVCDDCEKHCN